MAERGQPFGFGDLGFALNPSSPSLNPLQELANPMHANGCLFGAFDEDLQPKDDAGKWIAADGFLLNVDNACKYATKEEDSDALQSGFYEKSRLLNFGTETKLSPTTDKPSSDKQHNPSSAKQEELKNIGETAPTSPWPNFEVGTRKRAQSEESGVGQAHEHKRDTGGGGGSHQQLQPVFERASSPVINIHNERTQSTSPQPSVDAKYNGPLVKIEAKLEAPIQQSTTPQQSSPLSTAPPPPPAVTTKTTAPQTLPSTLPSLASHSSSPSKSLSLNGAELAKYEAQLKEAEEKRRNKFQSKNQPHSHERTSPFELNLTINNAGLSPTMGAQQTQSVTSPVHPASLPEAKVVDKTSLNINSSVINESTPTITKTPPSTGSVTIASVSTPPSDKQTTEANSRSHLSSLPHRRTPFRTTPGPYRNKQPPKSRLPTQHKFSHPQNGRRESHHQIPPTRRRAPVATRTRSQTQHPSTVHLRRIGNGRNHR